MSHPIFFGLPCLLRGNGPETHTSLYSICMHINIHVSAFRILSAVGTNAVYTFLITRGRLKHLLDVLLHSQTLQVLNALNVACHCHSITSTKSWYEFSVLVCAALSLLRGLTLKLACKCAPSDWQLVKDAWRVSCSHCSAELLKKQSYRFFSAAAQFLSILQPDTMNPVVQLNDLFLNQLAADLPLSGIGFSSSLQLWKQNEE